MQTVYIDLIPQKIKPVVMASQFDENRHVRFRLTENGEDYTLAGTETVTVTVRKPDGNIVVISPEVTANNYIDVYFTEQACACFGMSFGEITIEDDNSKIGTCNFDLEVELSPTLGGITSTSEIHNLETQVEEITTEIIGENYYDKSEVDTLLADKADANSVYTKTETDAKLALKANASSVYTKSETDAKLALKANASSVYTKTQVDSALALKANAADVYTKAETDAKIEEAIEEILPVDTAGPSAIASFTTGLALPLVDCTVGIVATGGNGTPENPNPINGYSEANVTRCGENLWDEEWELGTFIGGVLQPSTTRIRNKTPIPVKPNTTYRLVKPSDTVYVMQIDKATDWTKYSSSATSGTFTTAAWCNYLYISPDTTYGTTYNNDISINYPATETEYHAYNGQTYTIAFGQTVYGGVLDVTRGKLKPCIEYPSYNGETLSGRWLSSEATYIEGTTPPTGSQVVSLDDYGSEIDLTPEVISALVGTNNVYSDTNGDTTVQYKDSIQHYIDTHTGG